MNEAEVKWTTGITSEHTAGRVKRESSVSLPNPQALFSPFCIPRREPGKVSDLPLNSGAGGETSIKAGAGDMGRGTWAGGKAGTRAENERRGLRSRSKGHRSGGRGLGGGPGAGRCLGQGSCPPRHQLLNWTQMDTCPMSHCHSLGTIDILLLIIAGPAQPGLAFSLFRHRPGNAGR
jgi:hypothetical protein